MYDGQGTNTPLHVIDKMHTKPVCIIKYNIAFEVAVSVDRAGILEYWTGPKQDYKFPSKIVYFESKLDTSKRLLIIPQKKTFRCLIKWISGLYEFAKCKTIVSGMAFSNDGKRFATISTDRKVRVFSFLSGKMLRVFDETLARYSDSQHSNQAIPNMEFGRRYTKISHYILVP